MLFSIPENFKAIETMSISLLSGRGKSATWEVA